MKLILGVLLLLTTVACELLTIPEVQTMLTKAILLSYLPHEEEAKLHSILNLFRVAKTDLQPFHYRTEGRLTADCIVCRSAFQAIFNENKRNNSALVDSLTKFCTWLSYGNKNVCQGNIELNVPIIREIISQTPQATPKTFCGMFLQDENVQVCDISDPRFDWKIDLPKRSAYTRKSSKSNSELNVVIITDTHLDPKYKVNGEAECDEPICCRIGQQPASSMWSSLFPSVARAYEEDVLDKSFVKNDRGELLINVTVPNRRFSFSDIFSYITMKKRSSNAGFWGDYRTCDTPFWTFTDIIENIARSHIKKIDAIYYIGDTVHHGTWETNNDLVVQVNNYLIKEFRRVFGDNVLIVPTIGNHDSHPTNQFSSILSRRSNLSNTEQIYRHLAHRWHFYLTAEARKSFEETGSFSMSVKPGLRVISLNNNIAYKLNWWLVQDPHIAKRQLEVLVHELLRCEKNGEAAHILAHVPPGSEDLMQSWTREYSRVVDRFSDTITSEFNGHTHADEFKLFYNRGRPTNVAWGGGSATTYPDYNINYKYVTFHGRNFKPKDIKTYSYNLTEANLAQGKKPKWRLLYDMRTTYNLTDLSAKSMKKLVRSMVTDRQDLLDVYISLYSKNNVANFRSCDVECKLRILCRTVTTVLYKNDKCEELQQAYFETQI